MIAMVTSTVGLGEIQEAPTFGLCPSGQGTNNRNPTTMFVHVITFTILNKANHLGVLKDHISSSSQVESHHKA